MVEGDDGELIERLRKEMELEKKKRNRSSKKGKESFVEWIADLLKSLYNIVAKDIIGGIANWLWNLFFGNNDE